MEHALSAGARDEDGVGRVADALGCGVIVVDTNGHVIWIDDTTRRRVNGGLQNLALPLRRPSEGALDCFMAPVEVMIHGKPTALCVIQETESVKVPERDLIAAIQAAMADTSWFTRTIIDKLKALRQTKEANNAPSADDVDMLTGREREVLGLICEGRSDAEMSELLRLSPNTVRNHIVSLYRKIGVNRRGAAIIWARERGIDCLELVAPKRRRAPPDHHARS
jgi:DNA-binding CsgD family transcriptional regulator